MSARELWDKGVSWGGLVLGAGAWMLNQQGNYAAVPWVCAHRGPLIPVVAATLALVALAGSLLSWRTWRVAPSGDQDGVGGTPTHLIAGLSALIGILFAILILTQGAAALVLDGCER